MEDTSLVDKYKMSDEAYDKLDSKALFLHPLVRHLPVDGKQVLCNQSPVICALILLCRKHCLNKRTNNDGNSLIGQLLSFSTPVKCTNTVTSLNKIYVLALAIALR